MNWLKMASLLLSCAFLMTGTAAAQEIYGPPDQPPVSIVPDDWGEQKERARKRDNFRKVLPALVAVTAFDIADIVTTHECVKSVYCHEGNGIYGRSPSLGTILAIKGAEIAGTWLIAWKVSERSPLAANVFLGVRGVITADAVFANVRILRRAGN